MRGRIFATRTPDDELYVSYKTDDESLIVSFMLPYRLVPSGDPRKIFEAIFYDPYAVVAYRHDFTTDTDHLIQEGMDVTEIVDSFYAELQDTANRI